MGFQLLNRQTRPITLTNSGVKYLQGLEKIESIYSALLSESIKYSKNKKQISIGINEVLASRLLPEILSAYKQGFPNKSQRIFIEENYSNALENDLLEKEIDLHIRLLPIFSNKISYQKLFKSPIYLIADKTFLLFKKNNHKILSVETIDREKWEKMKFIFLYPGSGFSRLVDSFLNNHKIIVQNSFKIRSLETAANLAYEGLGCTFIPSFYLKQNFDSSKCNIFKLSEDIFSVQLVIAFLRDMNLNEETKKFIKEVVKYYKNKK
ncbi:transcriptional regulator [Oenococcus oeni]|uniref:LysR family transcriptional regulator substrate-binding protein n=2 Tax=Oenococcus oeni TaxID=1247 RepID=UPI000BDEEEE5|nr:LysR family transcriptional regulator substrate-binding protein [Oenococcus oeni]PDH88613.1 transcriptional regulator [Oenococcus oeni]PDH91051.1 transcriptional regulator [Oenococcus oeni]PDH91376.1 transcriptional regulator [Oenococcus oeni]PDH91593.1 transcriptional regulator [Oenococcus oeni]RJF38700.1 transcriptional regulator [Oenococcus oeni]